MVREAGELVEEVVGGLEKGRAVLGRGRRGFVGGTERLLGPRSEVRNRDRRWVLPPVLGLSSEMVGEL